MSAHPTELGAWPYPAVAHRALADAAWHYAIALPDGAELAAAGDAPSAAAPTQSIGLFRWPDGRAEVEVIGHLLADEIDAADWLENELVSGGRAIVSSAPVPGLAGASGDFLARWEHEGAAFVGRYAASKWGARLFIVCFRTIEADYSDLANDALAVCASLAAIAPSEGILAEDVIEVGAAEPVSWKTALPASWIAAARPAAEDGSWIDASHLALDRGEVDGRLLVAVLARSAAKRPRDAANAVLNAFRDGGFAIAHAEFREEPGGEPSWYLAAPAEQDGAAAEVRCRVTLRSGVWVVGGAVGPAKDDDPGAWMRNKRALDLATAALEIAP